MEGIIYFRAIERIVIAACVPLLIYIGYKLFLKGVTGEVNLTAKTNTVSAKLTNMSPGALCFVLGISLGAFIIYKGVNVTGPTTMYAGLGNNVNSLSVLIKEEYSKLGIKVAHIAYRPLATIDNIRREIEKTNAKFKVPVTSNALEEIEMLENKVIAGNEEAKSHLNKFHKDYRIDNSGNRIQSKQ